tara:strand:- start:2954 stop:3103 length:150 start_codon:yes stop_codon:yes gene_type:complete
MVFPMDIRRNHALIAPAPAKADHLPPDTTRRKRSADLNATKNDREWRNP